MAAVTQTVPNFLGGVSKQTDHKKLPGQVRDCLNAYPDPTFGLMKRPGFKFIKNIHSSSSSSSPDFADAKWFFIKQDDTEKYIGCITAGTPGEVKVWNTDGTLCTVTQTSPATDYLKPEGSATSKPIEDFDILTIQDTTIITNKTKYVTEQTKPTTYTSNTYGTVQLKNVAYGCKYGITIKIADTLYGHEEKTGISKIKEVEGSDDDWTAKLHYNLAITYASGSGGTGATADVLVGEAGTAVVMLNNRGSGYDVDDSLKIAGSLLGDSGTDITFKVADINSDLPDKVAAYIITPTTESLSGGSEANPRDEKYNTATRILTELEADLNDLPAGGTAVTTELPSGYTISVTRLSSSLEISITNTTPDPDELVPFELNVFDNQGLTNISAFTEEVNTIADLPAESVHGRLVKIVSSDGTSDDYWSKFIADDGVSGTGYWKETIDPTVSPGINKETLPHKLVRNSTNNFTLEQITWGDRLIGDDTTNAQPSFITKTTTIDGVTTYDYRTISQAFYYNNRLGFLSKDDVIMSKTNDPYNFYFTTALGILADDPIDVNCSSIRPADLHSVIPTAQGLILFSKNQQFILFADAEILTPSTATISAISNYETDSVVPPVEIGTTIMFVSKTPTYTRVFNMQTRGSKENPVVNDVGKIVNEWIPDEVNNILTNPQNSLIGLYDTLDNTMYLYKTYIVGDRILMQSWFNWDLPGNIQHATVDTDTMYAVVEYSGKYVLTSAELTQTPDEDIITTSDGQQVNPHMDLYGSVNSLIHVPEDDLTRCYLPPGLNDNENLKPVLVIAGNGTTNFAGVTESGFTINPDRPTGQTHATSNPWFEVPGKNLGGLTSSDVYVGYTYDYNIELPKTYFKLNPEGTQLDYTAALTVSRMKFAVGLSSGLSFKLKSKGYAGSSEEFTGDGSTVVYNVPFPLKEENGITVKLDGAVQASSTYTVTSTDYQATVTFESAPKGIIDNGDNTTTPAQKIEITTNTWYDIQTVQDANQYLADDVPLTEESVFTLPIHQRSDNFNVKVFSNSPFPVSLTSMMWEGQYSPRFYRRT